MKEKQSPSEVSKLDRVPVEEKKGRKVVEYISESPEFDAAYGLLLKHEYPKAVSLLEAAAEKGYPPAFVRLHIIYTYGRTGVSCDFKKASYYLEQMTQALQWYEERASLWHEESDLPCTKEDELEKDELPALSSYMYKAYENRWQACSCLAYMYGSGFGVERNAETSLQYSELALEQKPKDPILINNRCVELDKLNRFEEALASLEEALVIDPKFTFALNGQGHALCGLNRYEEALASYEAALVIDPKFTPALNGRGNALYGLNRYEEALASYEAALLIDSEYNFALNGRGNALYCLNHFEEALASYEAALLIDPKFTFALNGRGNALVRLNRLKEALASYEGALIIDPKFTPALNGRGNALCGLNRYEEALASYEAALLIDSEYKFALDNRARCLKEVGARAIIYKLKQLSKIKDSKKVSDISQTLANFQDCPLTIVQVSKLAECMLTHPTLRTVQLDRTQLSDAGLAILAEALRSNKQLTTLTFSENPDITSASKRFQEQIAGYLYRNRLLAADAITPEALRKIDFSVLSGDDIRALLLRHPKLETWDFSDKKLDSKAVILRPVYLPPSYPALHTLNLKGNRLGNVGAEQISLLLKTEPPVFPNLTELVLTDNHMHDLGLDYLADAIAGGIALKILDLSKNTILMSDVSLKEKAEQFSKNKRLEKVILTGNQLSENADSLLTLEEVKESKTKTECATLLSSRQSLTFFRSQALLMKSVLDPDKKIDQSQWIVALVCPKNGEHAMLYLEGMRKSGQRFMMCYHIVAPKVITGKAIVESNVIRIHDMIERHDHYNILPFEINHIQGKALQRHVRDQEDSRISFSKFYNCTTGKINCIGWCKAQLKYIEVKNVPQTGIPSVATGGSYISAAYNTTYNVIASFNPFGARR